MNYYPQQQPPPSYIPYLQLLEIEKQLLRQNDEQRARETRLGELDDAILDAEFQLAKRDIGIAAIEARVVRIEETICLISSGALLEPK